MSTKVDETNEADVIDVDVVDVPSAEIAIQKLSKAVSPYPELVPVIDTFLSSMRNAAAKEEVMNTLRNGMRLLARAIPKVKKAREIKAQVKADLYAYEIRQRVLRGDSDGVD